MTRKRINPDELLARAEQGALDDLSPAEIEALEAYVNADPSAAARLAPVTPTVEPALAEVSGPSAAEWARVWAGIDAACSRAAQAGRARRGPRRWLRVWEAVTAAAACVALAVLWRSGASVEDGGWPLQLSNNVEIESVEVYGDETSFVVYADDGSGRAVIWVLEDTGA